jgi:uncharacterized protein (DUF736 family)
MNTCRQNFSYHFLTGDLKICPEDRQEVDVRPGYRVVNGEQGVGVAKVGAAYNCKWSQNGHELKNTIPDWSS